MGHITKSSVRVNADALPRSKDDFEIHLDGCPALTFHGGRFASGDVKDRVEELERENRMLRFKEELLMDLLTIQRLDCEEAEKSLAALKAAAKK